MTTALALFDLADLTPAAVTPCGRCGEQPATVRVYAALNLLGVHPAWLGATRYRDACRRAHSEPCCTSCAWELASGWWSGCPCRGGVCRLWVHTLADPHPGWDCARHHTERTVVWRELWAVAA